MASSRSWQTGGPSAGDGLLTLGVADAIGAVSTGRPMLFPRANAAARYPGRLHLPGALALAGSGEPRSFPGH